MVMYLLDCILSVRIVKVELAVALIKSKIMAITFNRFGVNKFLYLGDSLITISLSIAITVVNRQEKLNGKYKKNLSAIRAI